MSPEPVPVLSISKVWAVACASVMTIAPESTSIVLPASYAPLREPPPPPPPSEPIELKSAEADVPTFTYNTVPDTPSVCIKIHPFWYPLSASVGTVAPEARNTIPNLSSSNTLTTGVPTLRNSPTKVILRLIILLIFVCPIYFTYIRSPLVRKLTCGFTYQPQRL